MPRPPRWSSTLQAGHDEAALAVKLYNDASESRAFEGFVVHMHLAWLYLLHAQFARDGVEYRYRQKGNPHRFEIIDGEHKRWELAKCVKERWPRDNEPVRRNLEFFIGLRNRIEHRHAKTDSNLGLAVSGHAQALLLNFEEELTSTFGSSYSLAALLRFPVFIGSFTDDGAETLRRLRGTLPRDLKKFIADFHAGLDSAVETDAHFEMRLRVVLEQVRRDPDALALQFTRYDDMSAEQRSAIEEMGKHGMAVVREQKRNIVGLGLSKPGAATNRIDDAIPFAFNQHHFLQARLKERIRPEQGSQNPERTDERYCIYIEVEESYGYTEAWIKRLIKKCATAEGFEAMTGCKPQPK